jgi:crotonobetainyl-CoA:carnitine CoA-transferase CaiB-like acyl-CoA transferase
MSNKPLAGLRVLEFSHMIMGPTAGLLMADLGADVIKVEPAPDGDHTRTLPGFAAGFFSGFNRNKRAIALNLKAPEGQDAMRRLVAQSDILVENYAPGTMERLQCGYEQLKTQNERLIYLALKGFLPGPYENRPALDEIVQFQAGLAYMTGPPGKPLRAGSSINDILGGVFGVTAVLAAVEERHRTGKGQKVTSALFETATFLMLTHMAGYIATGKDPRPMPVRHRAWAIYDVFDTAGEDQIFIGVTSDMQWKRLCEAFELDELFGDARLVTNAMRVQEREWMIPRLQEAFSRLPKPEIADRCEAASIPFAPVGKPTDLFDDPHLLASGGLLDVAVSKTDGTVQNARLPALPISFGTESGRASLERQPPKLGENGPDVLAEAGFTQTEIDRLVETGIVIVGASGKAARSALEKA